jgi:PAS domain S-box-containing protein
MTKQLTKDLKESEDRYRALFETSRDGIALIDGTDGLIVDCNPEYEAITGISKEKLLTMKVWETRPVEQKEMGIQVFRKILENGVGGSTDFDYHRPDGSVIASEFISRTVSIGGKTYIQSIVRNISERKMWEETLKASEEKYRAIFNQARDGIVLIDSYKNPGTIVDCNAEFERQTGRSLAELREMKIWQIRPKDKTEVARKKFFEIRETGVGDVSGLDFETPEGRIINIEFTSKRVRIGDCYYQQSITRDVTHRKKIETQLEEYRSKLERMVEERTSQLKETINKLERSIKECEQAEMALHSSEQKLRLMFDSAVEGIAVTDLEGNILEVNQAILQMHGFDSKKEIVGRSALQFISSVDYDRTMENLKKIFEEGQVKNIEYKFITKDGREFDAGFSASILRDASGDAIGIIAITRDISERKQFVDELRHKELQISNLAKAYVRAQEDERQWMALEIHDRIVQPLFTISQQIEQIKSQVSQSPNLLQAIDDNLNLVKEVNQETRSVMHHLYPSTLTRYGLIRLMNDELSKLGDEMDCQTKLSIRKNLTLDEDISATLYRVFHEALLNIRKHAGASNVTVSLKLRDSMFELKIEDDGVGFNVGQMEHGICGGLESMRRRIEIMGGIFKMTSKPGAGTKLVFQVPATPIVGK